MKMGIILLAGGQGRRMGGGLPKTFLELKGKIVARYSFDLFQEMERFDPIVVVAGKNYHALFPEGTLFAEPGRERQDSVRSGLNQLPRDVDFVLIHDGARPLINRSDVERLIEAGLKSGAAALGRPLVNTIKCASPLNDLLKTVPRAGLWEVYTPQMIARDLLHAGFDKLDEEPNSNVTDDLSLIELLGLPATLVESSYPNIKLTTPSDLLLIEAALL